MAESKYTGTERRKFVRIPFWFITKYRIHMHNDEHFVEFKQGVGRNISAGGICFEAKDKFKMGDVLEVEIDMPALEHAASVIGRVAWENAGEGRDRIVYGLEFTKIKAEDIEAVKKIIETFA